MKTKVFTILLSAAMLITMVSGCGNKQAVSKPEQKVKNVKVFTAQKASIVVENDFAGEIKAVEETGVIAKTPGKIKQIFVKVGDHVKTGDLLFTLDSDDIAAQLAQAEAGVEVAKANLEKTKSSGYTQSLLQARSEYDQAKLSYDDATTDYTRSKMLFDSNALSKKELDASKTKYDMAKQRFDNAQKNLELVEKSSGPESTRISESQLAQAISNVQLIKAQLNNMSVRAPISGVVSAKNINVGEGASSASPAIVISNTSALNAEINIPEKLINKFSIGQKLTVAVQTLEGKTFEGEVSNINPTIDAATKNYKVKIKLLSKTEEIRPGMFAKITLDVDRRDNVITVPNQAVVAESGVYFIFVVKDGKIVKTPIKIGISNHKVVEITQGLNPGDNLVTEGQSFLADGEAVNVMK